jgi:DNA-binding NarL/FixJ family response regulator
LGRILVIHHECDQRDQLVRVLLLGGLSVRCAGSVGEAARELRSRFDLFLVALTSAGLDGVDFIRRLGAEHRAVPAVVLSARGHDDRVIAAVAAGARGCLYSDDIGDRLVPAIREALEGGSPMSRGMGPLLLEHVRRSGRPPSQQRKAVRPITEGERRVLEQLARPLSYEQIGSVLGVSLNTVRTHVRVLYDKLDVNSRTEAVLVGMRLGLVKGAPYPGHKPRC